MTTPEHTLVGIHFAFAVGCHRYFGWSSVVMAGLASNIPDWDGLLMLFDMQRFEAGHRVWGHNILAITLSSLLLGWTQARYQWIERFVNWMATKIPVLKASLAAAKDPNIRVGPIPYFVIAMFAQLIHLPCDMVVSGGSGLTDWEIQPFWPFSTAGYVYPMIPWGDVGPTIILMIGVICLAKWTHNISRTSAITLVALCIYLIARAWSRGLVIA